MNGEYEIVHTMTDYYDGPRAGAADYQGVPHFYECLFDEKADNWSDTFLLAPIDQDTFKLVLEDWDIWQRWEQAYKKGKATLETHPVLPADRKRHEQIAPLLAERSRIDSETAIRAKADFRRATKEEPLTVQWFKVSG